MALSGIDVKMMNKELEYSWCWDCNSSTVDMNEGRANMCCARYDISWEDQQIARHWMENNQPPSSPSAEEIDKKLNCDNYTKEEVIICELFDAFSYGRYYWSAKQWADKIRHSIPTYEELCGKYGFDAKYDCFTSKEWAEKEKKDVLGKQGWDSVESFENEKIPWREFCRRMRITRIRAGQKPYDIEETEIENTN